MFFSVESLAVHGVVSVLVSMLKLWWARKQVEGVLGSKYVGVACVCKYVGDVCVCKYVELCVCVCKYVETGAVSLNNVFS